MACHLVLAKKKARGRHLKAFDLSQYGGVSNAIYQVSVAMAGDKWLRRAVDDIITAALRRWVAM